ncbi:hypothetical protein JNN96_34710 [Mycobacterium sp. DSM 3803]|nr:hypothetical protein [Mycobacterium sp. DSM 3803]
MLTAHERWAHLIVLRTIVPTEKQIIDQPTGRLAACYQQVEPDQVNRIVLEEYARFDRRSIRDFVSLSVERDAKDESPRNNCLSSAPQLVLSGKPSCKSLKHSVDRTQLTLGCADRATYVADRSHLANGHGHRQSACLRSKMRLQFGFLLPEEATEVLGLGLVSPGRRVMLPQHSIQRRPIVGCSEDFTQAARSALFWVAGRSQFGGSDAVVHRPGMLPQ